MSTAVSHENLVDQDHVAVAPAASEAHLYPQDQPRSPAAQERQQQVQLPPPQQARLERQLTIGYRTLTLEEGHKQLNRRTKKEKDAEEDINGDVHKLTLRELELRFGTKIDEGLPETVAVRRANKYGKNQITPPQTQWARKLFSYFFGGFCWLLWIACILTFLSWKPLGEPNPSPANLALAIVLIIVVLLQALFTAWQDWTTSRIMSSINNMIPQSATVMRDGKRQSVPGTSLVPGDIVTVEYGNKIPADIRLLEVQGLKLDNSILTGEALPITATVNATDDNIYETRNIALMGTFATEGRGMGVVVRTADRTMMGRVAGLTNQSHIKQTVLQREVQRFVYAIAALSITTAVLCYIWWVAFLNRKHNGFLSLANFMSDDMGIIVAFVPEGLPIAFTLVLTIIARRMYVQRVLVKSLTTVETLGCVNVLCSDKTGTLTTNQMTVNTVVTCSQVLDVSKTHDLDSKHKGLLQVASASHLCNGASFDPADAEVPMMSRRVNGDATDTALLRFGHSLVDAEAQKMVIRRLHQVPFNSKTKRMVSVVDATGAVDAKVQGETAQLISNAVGLSSVNERYPPVLFVKGAPDYIFAHCTRFLAMSDDGQAVETPLTESHMDKLRRYQEQLSSNGERVILIARRVLDGRHENSTWPAAGLSDDSEIDAFITDLCFLGLVGIVDPPRPETKGTVETLRGAGVRLFMVTGDFPLTAAAIARNVNIFTKNVTHNAEDIIKSAGQPLDAGFKSIKDVSHDPNGWINASLLLSGRDLTSFEEAHWDRVARYPEVVFARTTPEQKLFIVKAFQERGCIVAVTGDGTNDAPALKNAHIGVAMGSGSEVAIEAAAMVLLDSNFSSIIVALRQGRTVFENLKKVCLYLLPAGSFSELIPVLTCLFLGVPQPLTGFLMIIICVFTDLFPSLAIMYEESEGNLLSRPPRRPGVDNMVNAPLFMHAYLFVGLIEAFFSHVMYFVYLRRQYGILPNQLLLAFENWPRSDVPYSSDQQGDMINEAASVYFVTLVVLQFGNLFATRTRRASIFQQNPLRNWRLFAAMAGSIIVAAIVVYVPFFQTTFQTGSVPAEYWFIPLPVSLLIVILDEMRKWFVRTHPDSFLARLAW
ncbi:hypothetical protein RI367_003716 [Sorochytrium milnesiophthora]